MFPDKRCEWVVCAVLGTPRAGTEMRLVGWEIGTWWCLFVGCGGVGGFGNLGQGQATWMVVPAGRGGGNRSSKDCTR